MLTAEVIQSDNRQVIRLPEEAQTSETSFIVRKFGRGFILLPEDAPWCLLRRSIGGYPDDFLEDREQPLLSDLPEREYL